MTDAPRTKEELAEMHGIISTHVAENHIDPRYFKGAQAALAWALGEPIGAFEAWLMAERGKAHMKANNAKG
jgi:hypothetical protein